MLSMYLKNEINLQHLYILLRQCDKLQFFRVIIMSSSSGILNPTVLRQGLTDLSIPPPLASGRIQCGVASYPTGN